MAASISTSVDLSRLPAPVIVEQRAAATIRAEMLAELQAAGIGFNALLPSDPAVKLLDVVAYREQLLRAEYQHAGEQLLVAYAAGAALDHLAALVGVTRRIVDPADPLTGNAAVYEDDAALRQRIVLAPEEFAAAGPELAYVSRALGASGDVLDASAISPAPGEVRITILSRIGAGDASAALLAAVTAAVTNRAVRPLGDLVTVASAELVGVTIEAAITTRSGPDMALVLDAARKGLDAYLADTRRLGRDVTISGLHAALTAVGVARVVLASPVADVICGPTQAIRVDRIAITHAGYVD